MKANMLDGDYENVLISPDDSPVNSPKNSSPVKHEAGGRYVHMAQTYEAVTRSHKNLKSMKDGKPDEDLAFPPVVQIDL